VQHVVENDGYFEVSLSPLVSLECAFGLAMPQFGCLQLKF
jgi:hypothetical protein